MFEVMASFGNISFGGQNTGFQVGMNSAAISTNHFTAAQGRSEVSRGSGLTIPFQRDLKFVINQQLLDEVSRRISVPGSRVAVTGVGGIGKTHLAIECMYRLRHKSPETLIFWIYAQNAARLNQCYRNIADNLDIPYRNDPDTNIFHAVHSWLGQMDRKWVLVLDDMEDCFGLSQIPLPGTTGELENISDKRQGQPHMQLRQFQSFLSQSSNGSVLVTTRYTNIADEIATDRAHIHMDLMSTSHAVDLFQRHRHRRVETPGVRSFVQKLRLHPLLIVQAACYLRHEPHLWNTLQEKVERKFSSLQDHELSLQFSAILSVILDSVLYDLKSTSSSAFALLSTICFSDPVEIPMSLLYDTQEDREESRELKRDLSTLIALSLINIHRNTLSVTIHPMVELELRSILMKDDGYSASMARFIGSLHRQLPEAGFESRLEWRVMFPHVKAAIDVRPIPNQRELLLEWADLLYQGARYARLVGETEDMRQMAAAAMDARHELLGPDDFETIKASMELILAYLLNSKPKEAESLAAEQVQRCDGLLCQTHPTSLAFTGQLALAKWYQGQWVEAELPSLKLLDIARQNFGLEHPETLIIMGNLASVYDNQGRWDEAEKFNTEVLEIRRRTLGPESTATLTSMNNLAVTYQNQGRLKEAEELMAEVLETRKRVFGLQHPDTLTAMNNLASIYHAQGKLTLAEDIYTRVLNFHKDLRGNLHRDTVVGQGNLAKIYQAQGRTAEAAALEKQVLEKRETILGLSHPDTLKSLVSLAAIYASQGRLQEAETMQKRAIEVQTTTLGSQHPDVVSSMESLASIYRNQGRLQDAEEIYVQVLKHHEALLGLDHPSTLETVGELALVLLDMGRLEEAEVKQLDSVQRQERLLGPEHPAVLAGLDTLARIFKAQNRPDEAENAQCQVLESRKRTLGEEHPDTLDSMENLAIVLLDIDQWEEAEVLATKVNQVRAKSLRGHHPGATKVDEILRQISQIKLARGISNDHVESLGDSDFGSVISMSVAGSDSSATSFDSIALTSAVEVFASSILKVESFQQVCRFSLEKGESRARILRNLMRALQHFASHLANEQDFVEHSHVTKFLRRASFNISSLILQSLDVSLSGLEESNIRQLKEVSSRARVLEYLESRQSKPKSESQDQSVAKQSDPTLPRSARNAIDSDSDSVLSADSSPDVQEQTIVDELQRLEASLFKTNAFHLMQRELFDFAFPSLRSELSKWISVQSRKGDFTRKQLRDLEVVVSELQHVPPERLIMSFDEDFSLVNRLKGRWETFTAEKWNWWPLRPYMRQLKKGEARLHWQCCCGRNRWAEVPIPFARKATSPAMASASKNTPQSLLSPQPTSTTSAPNTSGTISSPGHQGGTHNSTAPNPGHSISQQQQQQGPGNKLNLHVFLIVTHSSPFGRSKRLAQTPVSSMKDDQFFSWVRSMYYHHRGFFPIWFGVYKYSHCEFFKFERFLQAGYAPLTPEFPGPQQAAYHFYPKPISPDPPVSPHEFHHWFLHQSWCESMTREFSKRFSKTPLKFSGFEDVVVREKLPKRESHLEELDSSRQLFWGLYIVEERSASMLAVYSFIFLIPSFYFLFAWLFQWEHYGDLQNASVPLSVSIGLLGTFWGIISFNAPRFDGGNRT